MRPETLLYVILAIVIIDYLLDQLLDYLNYKSTKTEFPAEVSGFYDRDKYEKSIEYQKVRSSFSFVTSAFSFILSISLLYFGVFGLLDRLIAVYVQNDLALALIYFGALFILSDLLNTPFQLYSTFVIEEKFGFNKTSVKTFLFDKIKGYSLAVIIGGLLISVLLLLVLEIGPDFWMYFWVIAIVFLLLFEMSNFVG
ncbi:MAG: hypothetical protein AAGF85_15895 [Bacteroidota bacterium]